MMINNNINMFSNVNTIDLTNISDNIPPDNDNDNNNNISNIIVIPNPKAIKAKAARKRKVTQIQEGLTSVSNEQQILKQHKNHTKKQNKLVNNQLHNQRLIAAAVTTITQPDIIAMRLADELKREMRKKKREEKKKDSNNSSVDAASSNNATRTAISLLEKIQILDYIEKNSELTVAAVAEHFKKPATTISTIKSSAKSIRQKAQHTADLESKRFNDGKYQIVERCLVLWIRTMRQHNNSDKVRIGYTMAIEKAKTINKLIIKKLKESNEYIQNPGNCTKLIEESEKAKFSSGWYDNLIHRNGLRSMILHGEGASTDQAAVDSARKLLQIELAKYNLADIYNVDELALFYKLLPSRSYEFNINAANVRGDKKKKHRVTVVVCTNADGSDRIRPMVIGKYENPRPLKNLSKKNLNCVYSWQKKSWMDFSIFVPYLQSINDRIRNETPNRKVLMLVDGAGAHKVETLEAMQFSNMTVKVLPPNTTSHIQPLDAGVIHSLKAKYRTIVARETLASIELGEGPLEIDLRWAINNIAVAWYSINKKTIHNCWLKTKILSAQQEIQLTHLAERQANESKSDVELLKEFFNALNQKAIENPGLGLEVGCDVESYIHAEDNEPTSEPAPTDDESIVVQELVKEQNVTFPAAAVEEKEEEAEDDEVQEIPPPIIDYRQFLKYANDITLYLQQRDTDTLQEV